MKRIPSEVKLFLIVVSVPIVLIAALFALAVGGFVIGATSLDNKCSYYKVDALPSPTGQLSVTRVEHRCPGDEGAPPMMFALQSPSAEFDNQRVFLRSSDYDGLSSSLGIFAKWIDDYNLLIAAPEGSFLKTMRTDFHGIHIEYSFYPLDSSRTKDEYLRKKTEKAVDFEIKFEANRGIGLPGAGCQLEISAHDGEYVDRIALYLRARTTFGTNAWDNGKTVYNPGFSVYDFLITARDDVEKPEKHATGADIPGYSPLEGKSTLSGYGLNYPGIMAPAGTPMPKWQFMYSPQDPLDLISMARNIKADAFSIQVGYWLDDDVVVYSAKLPVEKMPFDEFEKCVKENHILDTPRFIEKHGR